MEDDFSKMVFDTTQFDGMLVDMVIGLPSNIEQYKKRPDRIARKRQTYQRLEKVYQNRR